MGQIQGNVEVLQALHDVAGQAAGIRHDLHAGQYFGTFQRHAAGHDQADVAAAEDEHPLAYQIALHVDIALGSTGGVDAGGAGTGMPMAPRVRSRQPMQRMMLLASKI